MTILSLTGIVAGVFLALATWRWPAPAPVEVRVLNYEPAGILDNDGVEMRLVTFGVTKSPRYQDLFNFQPHSTKVWIEVSSRWREVDDPPSFSLVPHSGPDVWSGTNEIVLLMPPQPRDVEFACAMQDHQSAFAPVGHSRGSALSLR
jgi:hypothetical protein